jgi:hypothetical protein
MLDRLADHGIVQHLPNPAQGRNYQMEALKDAKKQPIVSDADWIWVSDVDEFLNIHIGDHTIPTLIKACNNPMAISAHFQFFANAGVKEYVDKPVIEQFIYSHNPDIHGAEMAIEVKSLLRKDFPLHYLGAHRPFQQEDLSPEDQPSWTDCSGRKVPHKFLMHANKRRICAFPAAGSRNFATLNHYALRSLDSYLVKNDRGDVNRENRAFDDTYWREQNDTAFHDPSITRYLPDLRKEMDRLLALDGIAELHQGAVAAHIAKRDELLAHPAYREMYDHLASVDTMPPAELKVIEEFGLAS